MSNEAKNILAGRTHQSANIVLAKEQQEKDRKGYFNSKADHVNKEDREDEAQRRRNDKTNSIDGEKEASRIIKEADHKYKQNRDRLIIEEGKRRRQDEIVRQQAGEAERKITEEKLVNIIKAELESELRDKIVEQLRAEMKEDLRNEIKEQLLKELEEEKRKTKQGNKPTEENSNQQAKSEITTEKSQKAAVLTAGEMTMEEFECGFTKSPEVCRAEQKDREKEDPALMRSGPNGLFDDLKSKLQMVIPKTKKRETTTQDVVPEKKQKKITIKNFKESLDDGIQENTVLPGFERFGLGMKSAVVENNDRISQTFYRLTYRNISAVLCNPDGSDPKKVIRTLEPSILNHELTLFTKDNQYFIKVEVPIWAVSDLYEYGPVHGYEGGQAITRLQPEHRRNFREYLKGLTVYKNGKTKVYKTDCPIVSFKSEWRKFNWNERGPLWASEWLMETLVVKIPESAIQKFKKNNWNSINFELWAKPDYSQVNSVKFFNPQEMHQVEIPSETMCKFLKIKRKMQQHSFETLTDEEKRRQKN